MIFGGGAEFATAKKIVADHELSNVIIHDLLPSERVSEVYSLGDIALITCKKALEKQVCLVKRGALWHVIHL